MCTEHCFCVAVPVTSSAGSTWCTVYAAGGAGPPGPDAERGAAALEGILAQWDWHDKVFHMHEMCASWIARPFKDLTSMMQ